MPIWSLTQERLDKLKNMIAAKKAEYDALNALTEKDLWIKDLDDFADEWNEQLRQEAEIASGIRKMGRRASYKIGAGKTRRAKGDDDYEPVKKPRAKAIKAEKVDVKAKTKTQERFAEKFQAKAKPEPENDLSDDDFALLGKKTVVKEESEPPRSAAEATSGRNKRAATTKSKYVLSDDSDDDFMELGKDDEEVEEEVEEEIEEAIKEVSDSASEEVVEKPSRRVAASKAKSRYIDDDASESDDDMMLGDVGAMVKGIGAPASSSSNGGRLSLFAMSRPEAGEAPIPKLKSKPSKSTLDFDSHDDTNYEALAMSSPRKSTKADDLDDFLSDDDLPAVTKPAAKPAASSKAKAALSVVPAPIKKRGRPAGAKNKDKDDAPAPKPTKAAAAKASKAAVAPAKTKVLKAPSLLSPAAKAYAAKKAKASTRKVVSDDDEDDIVDEAPSPVAAKPKARPGRAAAAKAKPVYIIDDDDDEEDSFASGGGGGGGRKRRMDDSDAFGMDEDSD